MRPASMSRGVVWAFAFGAIVLGMFLAFWQQKLRLGNSVGLGMQLGVWGAAGFLGVYLTKATKGQGVVAFLVASLALSIASYFIVAALFSHATTELTGTVGQLGGASRADTQRFAASAGSVFGGFFGVVIAIVQFLIAFISGLVGCLAGGSAKARAATGVSFRAAA